MVVRLYVAPNVGHIPLQKLSPGDVQRVISSVLDKGLSPTTAKLAYATLHRALECAMKWGAVHRNVCDAIDAPRVADYEANPPDKAAVKLLLEMAMEGNYGPAFGLLASTGARRGEACALRWEHADLDKGTLSIVGSVGRHNGKLTVSQPKSTASRRRIHLDASTVTLLRHHRAQQAEYRLGLGPLYQDQGLVFTSPTGGLLDPDILTKTWQKICREAGVKYRLHDLRHAHVTRLIEAGTDYKTVPTRLGHSSPSFTLAVYAHISAGMDKEAAEAYARAMSE